MYGFQIFQRKAPGEPLLFIREENRHFEVDDAFDAAIAATEEYPDVEIHLHSQGKPVKVPSVEGAIPLIIRSHTELHWQFV